MSDGATDTKLSDMPGVREYGDGAPVELGRDGDTGRLVVVAYNEGGHNCTSVDLGDLLAFLASKRGLMIQAKVGFLIRRA
jgi:hypothetical protein